MRTALIRNIVLLIVLSVGLLSFTGNTANAQDTSVYSFCLESTKNFGSSGGSDCWGWRHPSGVEYAIMGVNGGVAFVNTETMATEGFVDGPTGGICGFVQWRDMMTWGDYCYVVSECNGTNDGIMVIDMSHLPDSVELLGTFAVDGGGQRTSHNLCVDSLKGYLYVEGTNSPSTSVYLHSLADPANPVFIGAFGNSAGIHDIYAMNDTVYVAEGWSGKFSIWDLSNKSTPTVIAQVAVPNPGYVHNIWPTDDRDYVVTTEETANKTVKVWDIRDLGNVNLVGQYLAPNGLAHNAQLKGDTIYLSHYESGVALVDITDAANPVEIARYDTYPQGETPPAFNGAWGCYPFASNGLIYGSNIGGKLTILRQQQLQLADTIYSGVPSPAGGNYVTIDVYAINSQPLQEIILPFSYAGPSPLEFVACSTTGTRTDYFQVSELAGVDSANERAAWRIAVNNGLNGTPLSPGSGKILTIWFQIPGGYFGSYDPISFIDDWAGLAPTFTNECVTYRPADLPFTSVCCFGLRGNVDSDPNNNDGNILDLTYLVDFTFRGGSAPICPAEANLDGLGGEGDIVDLTYLVDYIFRGGPPPVACE